MKLLKTIEVKVEDGRNVAVPAGTECAIIADRVLGFLLETPYGTFRIPKEIVSTPSFYFGL